MTPEQIIKQLEDRIKNCENFKTNNELTKQWIDGRKDAYKDAIFLIKLIDNAK